MTMPSAKKSIRPPSSSELQTTNQLIEEIAAFYEDRFEKSIIDGEAKQILQDPGLRVTRFAKKVTSFVRNKPLSPLKPVLGAVGEDVDADDTDDGSVFHTNEVSTDEDVVSEDICFDESERSVEAGDRENILKRSSKDQNTPLPKTSRQVSANGDIVAPSSTHTQWDKWHEMKGRYSTEAKIRSRKPSLFDTSLQMLINLLQQTR